jgi:hypothetical protein
VARTLACLAVVLCLACPERRRPERGTQLVYAKASGANPREAVERRLARAGIVARLAEDATRLTVRLGEDGDVASVKALLAVPGKLELCAIDEAVARAFCARATGPGVTAKAYGETDLCALSATDEATLKASLGEVHVRFERGGGAVLAHAVAPSCFAPRFTAGERRGDEPRPGGFPVSLTFDAESAREFEALTKRNLGKPLIVSLDGAVLFAPIVLDAITGGKTMLTLPAASPEDADRLLTAIVGGPVEGLVLEQEARYGPPSLR